MKPTPYRIAVSILFYAALIGGGCLVALEWETLWGRESLAICSLGVALGWYILCVWGVQRAIDLGIWMGWDHEEETP